MLQSNVQDMDSIGLKVLSTLLQENGAFKTLLYCFNFHPLILIDMLGPPTQGKQYEKLLWEESLKELAGIDEGVGDAHFINTGMRLERDQ